MINAALVPDDERIHALLLEDNPGDARLIERAAGSAHGVRFEVERVSRLAEGLDRLARGGIDLVIVDLFLPDSRGLETFAAVRALAPDLPVIVLSGLADEELALRTVSAGAQDYLVKGSFDLGLLGRFLRQTIERHGLQRELERLALVDDLTGLYNRRGFLTLGAQQLLLADRQRTQCLILFADVDDLKGVNDALGHHEGDRLLCDTAAVLRETFRKSDVIGRIGGDEFCVLLAGGSDDVETVERRLGEELERLNAAAPGRPYALSLSVGAVRYDPEFPRPLGELLGRADELMYRRKSHRARLAG